MNEGGAKDGEIVMKKGLLVDSIVCLGERVDWENLRRPWSVV